jgi:hypothetical protein
VARKWTEDVARKLCYVTVLMITGCVYIAVERLLYAYQIWEGPHLPSPWGGILQWVFLALCILFALDRGVPTEGAWSGRLQWIRRGLLVAVAAAVIAVVKLP